MINDVGKSRFRNTAPQQFFLLMFQILQQESFNNIK